MPLSACMTTFPTPLSREGGGGWGCTGDNKSLFHLMRDNKSIKRQGREMEKLRRTPGKDDQTPYHASHAGNSCNTLNIERFWWKL